MKKYKIAFIGTGGRSVSYALWYAEDPQIEVVAICDPNPQNRKIMIEKSKLTNQPVEYDDYRELLREQNDLDGLVITSPNHLHTEHAVASFEKGIPIVLEKPLATTMEDCERILEAEKANNGRCILGFVLRSTPFYNKIYELINADTIGRVISIQADELPGSMVSSVLNRGLWRRQALTSGGLMLEKSCHDMDIFNWMTGSRPVALNSFGGRGIFCPSPLLPEKCDTCKIGDDCLYYIKPDSYSDEDDSEKVLHDFTNQQDKCIFNIDSDNFDHQAVSIQYANGAIVNFMLSLNCMGARAGRTFHAIGLKGQIWGNHEAGKIYLHDNQTGETSEYDCSGDGTGHGGGNRIHALQLLRMIKEPDYNPEQNTAAGYLAAAMCFAADRSVTEHRRVNFRYIGNDRINII
jgi:predicted dehydrogenase